MQHDFNRRRRTNIHGEKMNEKLDELRRFFWNYKYSEDYNKKVYEEAVRLFNSLGLCDLCETRCQHGSWREEFWVCDECAKKP